MVFIFGFTAILGKFITLEADTLVWYRMIIGAIGIAVFLAATGVTFKLPRKSLLIFLGTGVIIAAHWVTFFGSIKVGNVSVTLACMSSSALFTALLKPLVLKEKIIPYEIYLGILVVAGIIMIFSFEFSFLFGIVLGLISAALAGLFTLLNARYLKKQNASVISLYEMIGGVISLTVYLGITGQLTSLEVPMSTSEWVALVLLGVVCTSFAFVASIWVMKRLSPFTVSLSVNMEPVYGILMAFFIWRESETMSAGFYAGAALIMATLFANAWFKKRRPEPEQIPVQS